ncbi:MAG: response regulator [Roseiarcus sp.]|jgi:CheY-like chemotaxis protein
MNQSPFAGPPAVLVVEDEEIIRLDAVDLVKDAGFEAYEAADSDEALRLLEAHGDIGILFTDVDIPGSMDGLTLAHAARRRWPPMRIIVASGKLSLREPDLPAESAFFGKPYRPAQILVKLQEMARRAVRG